MIRKPGLSIEPSVFTEMTALAIECEAVNLAQGFPDFEGPPEIVEWATAALREGHNQYSRSAGMNSLTEAIAESHHRWYGLEWDPAVEVTVFAGATEGIAAAILATIGPGDEALTFEPYYDSYPALVRLAGGELRTVPLEFPDYAVDLDALERAITPRTRVLIVNTPHNPTGKVFRREELEALGELCERHDLAVISDEVYEHITFELPHTPLASIPSLRNRTLTLSSTGKTFSFTGWKIGWGLGNREWSEAVRATHQFLTFCAATPLQVAMGEALRSVPAEYYDELRTAYRSRRDLLVEGLREVGFQTATPEGSYFALADYSAWSDRGDREFAHWLTREVGVAAIPTSAFCREAPSPPPLLRFAFCKTEESLRAGLGRLARR